MRINSSICALLAPLVLGLLTSSPASAQQTISIPLADCRGWLRSYDDVIERSRSANEGLSEPMLEAFRACVGDLYRLRSAEDCDAAWQRFQTDARRDREIAGSSLVLSRFRELCPALTVPTDVPPARLYPAFQTYYARPYLGRVAQPRLATAEDRRYRTRIRDAVARQRTDFAGDHVVFQIGCGSSCITAGVVNARTGAVIWFPFSVVFGLASMGDTTPIDYHLDSRMLVLSGLAWHPLSFSWSGTHYFEFDGRRFNLIRYMPHPPPARCECPAQTEPEEPAPESE